MVDVALLLRAFAEYARTVAGPYDVADVLDRLTDQVAAVVKLDGAGVCLADGDAGLTFVTATDARVAVAEEQQIRVGQGPCQDVYARLPHVTSADLTLERRWPAYTPTVLAQGYRSVAGIQLAIDEQRVGALDLYRLRPGGWRRDELEVAQVLADMAAGYIINARVLADRSVLAEQLQRALDSRIVIEQAKGVLAERHGIPPAAAFERLRTHARTHNRRLADVARAVLDGRLPL